MRILSNKLTQHIPHLPNSERKAALYIVSNIESVIGMSISEVAEKSHSSTAAIVRLCKKLDLEGFPDMKRALAKEIYSTNADIANPDVPDIEETSDMTAIMDALITSTSGHLGELKAALSASALEKTIDRILESRYVLLCGMGASGLVADDFNYKLSRLGICSAYPMDTDVQTIQASTLHETDTAFMISYSGESDRIVRAARAAKKTGATIIALTRIGGSSLSRMADIVLNVPDSEAVYRQGATSSRICQLMVIDILYRGLINKARDGKNRLISTWNVIREK